MVQVSTAAVTAPAEDIYPEILVSFRQFELSYVQSRGVVYILAGTGVMLISGALAWANSALSRTKVHHA